MGLCRKKERLFLLSMLDYVCFDTKVHNSAPRNYVGVCPSMMSLYEFPVTAEDYEALGPMLSTVTDLQIVCENSINDHLNHLISMGPHLERVERLLFHARNPEADSPLLLASWIPYMKSLKDLEIIWRFNVGPATLDALKASGTNLKILRLSDYASTDSDRDMNCLSGSNFDQFQKLADRMPSVEQLVLPFDCFAQLTSKRGVAKLKNTERVFSSMSIPFDRVYLAAKSHAASTTEFIIPLHGFLFAVESDRTIARDHLNKLIQIGVDHALRGGDTTLTYLLAEKLPHSKASEKVKVLLEVGADPLKKCPIFLRDGFGYLEGNAVHIAAQYGSKSVTETLLNNLDWGDLDISDFRMSNGFLPIHLTPCEFGVWLEIYRRLNQRFPNINLLLDSANVHGWIPLHAVIESYSTTVAEAELLTLLECILRECPSAATHTEPSFGPPSLLCSLIGHFCTALYEGQYSPRAYDLVQKILVAQLPNLRRMEPCTLSELGFGEHPDRSLGVFLFGCSVYAPQLFHHVVTQCSPTVRAVCLQSVISAPPLPTTASSISIFVSLGFELVLPRDMEPILETHPVWHFIASHWVLPPEMTDIDEYLDTNDVFDRKQTSSFWETLWVLVDAFKDVPMALTAEISESFQLEEILPPPDELMIFSEPDDVARFLKLVDPHCSAWVSLFREQLEMQYEIDNDQRKVHGLENRFQALFDHILAKPL